MAVFTVNGKTVTAEKNQKLLRFLRDELRLTSVKDGCSEGACGTCHVLIDGKATKACVPSTDKLEGKTILTVEGLSDWEKAVYTYAFGKAGAVQCGFCIPGMVISAKGLIDQNPDPTREEAAFAIRNNICRCTGYVKIIDGILLAAKILREGKIPEKKEDFQVGSRVHRIDVAEKVQGYGKYPDDVYVDGMCYGGAVRSQYPRARVLYIRTKEAEALPGVICVLTAKDIPGQQNVGHIQKDQPTLIGEGEITQYLGDAVALVCARDQETLEKAKKLVRVVYEELPAVYGPEEASAPGAPEVIMGNRGNLQAHRHVVRGNADEAIKNSKYVVTRKYKTGWQEHGFMEPECCVAMPEGADGLLIYTTSQSVYDVQRECAQMLQIPKEKVHCRAPLVGGGFGGKEDMSVQQYAALMAWATKKPVKVKYSRQESLDYHVKRHPMEMEFTTACDENGILTGMKGIIIADTGAYASLGGPVLHRACTHAAGPYNYQNIDIFGMSVYTNNVVSGAFRGFGVTQSCFATEMNINLLAEMVGIDPWEFRRRNAIKPGDVLPNGQTADPNTNMAACLDAVKDIYYAHPYAGIACGFKNSGTGMGKKDIGRVLLSVEQGKIHIRTSASCMGQGIGQMVLTEICHVTELDPALFVFEAADTVRTPDAGTSTASRQTVMTGEAARRVGEKLKLALSGGKTIADLEGQEFLGEYSAKTDPLGAIKENPISHVSYSYGAQVIILNEQGRIEKAVSAFDVGTPVNIQSVEGQIEGGMVMGIGYGVTEKFECVDGYPKSRFGTIGFMRATEAPELEVILCQPKEADKLPFSLGAKGCGELCMIPTAPACAHAYYRLDGKFRQSLPLSDTPYRK